MLFTVGSLLSSALKYPIFHSLLVCLAYLGIPLWAACHWFVAVFKKPVLSPLYLLSVLQAMVKWSLSLPVELLHQICSAVPQRTSYFIGWLDQMNILPGFGRLLFDSRFPHLLTTMKPEEEIVNRMDQLGENIANLQAANEEFRTHQDFLLDEIGHIKIYLELLYHQLKEDETVEDFVFPPAPDPGRGVNDVNQERRLSNPPAHIETSMDEFGRLNLHRIYREGHRNSGGLDDYSLSSCGCWLRPPRVGDYILFQFRQPILLKSFRFGTGHYQHPANKLSNCTVEISPLLRSARRGPAFIRQLSPSDQFLVVGRFDHAGLAYGEIDWHAVGPVRSLRIQLHSGCLNWVVITELCIETVSMDNLHHRPADEMTMLPSIAEEECEYW